MELLALLLLFVLGLVPLMLVNAHNSRGKKKIETFGYEVLSFGDGGTGVNYYSLCLKNDIVYIFHGSKVERAVPIEVIGVSEITRNTQLVQLEIRYRENGVVRSTRFKGGES